MFALKYKNSGSTQAPLSRPRDSRRDSPPLERQWVLAAGGEARLIEPRGTKGVVGPLHQEIRNIINCTYCNVSVGSYLYVEI